VEQGADERHVDVDLGGGSGHRHRVVLTVHSGRARAVDGTRERGREPDRRSWYPHRER
jgi:hypothetical protein